MRMHVQQEVAIITLDTLTLIEVIKPYRIHLIMKPFCQGARNYVREIVHKIYKFWDL